MMIYLASPNVKGKDGSGVLPEIILLVVFVTTEDCCSAIPAQANAELN